MDYFCALPDDILYLISKEIEDHGSLFSLSNVSKNFYEVFNCRLYKAVDSGSKGKMHTVALSQSARVPLTGSHPASSVKTLRLSHYPRNPDFYDDFKDYQEQERIAENLLREQANSALNNIAAHHGVLHRLVLSLSIDLHKVLELNSNQFHHLKELVVECPLLKKESIDVFVSLVS